MNADELRKVAAELKIKGRSKMTKDELSDAIFEHPDNPLTVNKHGDVTDPRDHAGTVHIAPVGTDPADFSGWETLGYTDLTDPFEFPSVEGAHQMAEYRMPPGTTYAGMTPDEKAKEVRRRHKRNKLTTDHKIVRQIRASHAKYYGIFGRGMGAKHYASRSNPFPVPYVRPAIVGRGLTGAR